MQGVNESDQSSFEKLSGKTHVIQVIFNIVYTLLTVIGNSLVCAAYHQNENIQTPSNTIVLSMAYCDLLMVLSFLLKTGSAFSEPGIRFYLCIGSSSWGFVITSLIIIHLCAISIDRLMAVKYSLRYTSIVTRAKVLLSLLGIWMFGLFELALIPLVMSSSEIKSTLNQEVDPCMTFWTRPVEDNQTWRNRSPLFKALSICTVLFVFVLPILIIVLSYSYIWRQAWKHSKQIRAQKEAVNVRFEKHFQTHNKSTKTFAIVIGVFLVSFMPVFIVMCKRTISFTHVGILEGTIVVILAQSSVIWNPIIYAWRNREFRTAFRKISRTLLRRS